MVHFSCSVCQRQQFDAIQVVHFSCGVSQRQQFNAIQVVHFSCSVCQRQQFDAIQVVHFSCGVSQRQQYDVLYICMAENNWLKYNKLIRYFGCWFFISFLITRLINTKLAYKNNAISNNEGSPVTVNKCLGCWVKFIAIISYNSVNWNK